MEALRLPAGYRRVLEGIKERIRTARVKAAFSVNRELVLLYWDIGREILSRQERAGWGGKVIDRLAQDLQSAFPGVAGFSGRNLKYMRAFAKINPLEAFVQAVLAQIPWYHNIALLDKVANPAAREWYARAALQMGWSRNVLVHQIESGLYERQGKAVTNFKATLPPLQSDLAEQALKDPYTFDFLTLLDDVHEKELERGLVGDVRKFLLELGVGFAFEYAGKMSFYLSAVDDMMRHKDDCPSVGLVLCRSKNKLVAEYALRDMRKPIGVSAFRLTRDLPAGLEAALPSVTELERELRGRK